MDKMVMAYEAECGSIMAQVDVEDRDDAFSAALNVAFENDFHINDIDFDEDGCLHGYDDDGEQVADFQYISADEYEAYMKCCND